MTSKWLRTSWQSTYVQPYNNRLMNRELTHHSEIQIILRLLKSTFRRFAHRLSQPWARIRRDPRPFSLSSGKSLGCPGESENTRNKLLHIPTEKRVDLADALATDCTTRILSISVQPRPKVWPVSNSWIISWCFPCYAIRKNSCKAKKTCLFF